STPAASSSPTTRSRGSSRRAPSGAWRTAGAERRRPGEGRRAMAPDVVTGAAAPVEVVRRERLGRALRNPVIGPLGALVIAVVVVTVTTDTFATVRNAPLSLQQSIGTGTPAPGPTLIILTAGTDLSTRATAG